ncbi:MAG: dicarboxylate/amino acid:cation symporter [Chlamydiales bacterium]|nr:dicarboxylate/amino acid:cation symporter [Chlamydiales bacterium]
MKSNIFILLAFVLGACAGLLNQPIVFVSAKVLSGLFINFLKMISLPVIFLSIVATITNMTSLREAKHLLRKIVTYTVLTTLLSATIALILFLQIKPQATGYLPATAAPDIHLPSYLSFIKSLIPSNIIQPFAENNVISVAFIATILSFAILRLPKEHKAPLQTFFQALFQALLKVSSGIVRILPIGVFCFTVMLTNQLISGDAPIKPLLLYACTVIGANLIQGLIALPLLLKSKGIAPLKLARAMFPALATAFFSKSSNAALPLALSSAQKNANLSPRVSSFSFPLCSVINMNGCAAFILITVLFVLSSSGYALTLPQMLPWIAIASIAAIGNAGVPMGCYFLTSAFLIGFNVRLELMGLILPLYSIFDMVETALNVWSDSCVTAITDKELRTQEPLESAC